MQSTCPSTSGRAASSCASFPRGRPFSSTRPTVRASNRNSAVPDQSDAFTTSEPSQSARSSASQMRDSRRSLLLGGLMLSTVGSSLVSSFVLQPPAAQAFATPPSGFRSLVDRLDGYSFLYPEGWLTVTSSGNDCFLRNPRNIDENLFVDITSPSSSKYETVADLGSPEDTAKTILEQYLNKEFMSTRIGIRREGSILSSSSRTTPDGRTFYDVKIRITSYGSRNPYVATQAEVLKDYGLEWDRVLFTTLGVANNRLYELRLQTAQESYAASAPQLDLISKSFTLKEVEV